MTPLRLAAIMHCLDQHLIGDMITLQVMHDGPRHRGRPWWRRWL